MFGIIKISYHSITNKQNDVLGLLDFCQRSHDPVGHGLGAIVVGKSGSIFARLIEGKLSVSLCCYIDHRRRLCIDSEQILEPGEVPPLDFRLGNFEKAGSTGRSSAGLGDVELEVLVRHTSVGFGAVDGGVDFDTDVKELTGEEISSGKNVVSKPEPRVVKLEISFPGATH